MNRIRIERLLAYYLESLGCIVDRCISLQNDYIDGRISYRRTRNELWGMLQFGWQRANLCDRLNKKSGGQQQAKYESLVDDLRTLTDWTVY